jgi:ribosomal-protein-alanine N-acetyltransferase
MIARPYWNQGLGTEAANGIKEHAFRNYPFGRLISLVEAENIASQRVAEKNGMHYEKDAEHEGLLFRVYVVNKPEKRTLDPIRT